MLLALYSFIVWLMQPLVLRKALHRAALEPLYAERMGERLGHYRMFTPDPSRPLVWLHAVSLGEVRAAAILLKELRLAMPTMRLLLTNGTATGRAEGAKLLQAGDVQVWQPWDTQFATQQFFAHFKPALGVLIETEVWPNLIASAHAAGVPIVLANARMSEKSCQQALKWKWLSRPAYAALTQVYAQTQEDAKRLELLGAKVSGVFGNVKFDITPNEEQLTQAKLVRSSLGKPLILFASSREGEEATFLQALSTLPEAQRDSVHWLIVPRHPQRFDEVAGLIEAAGYAVLRRHAWGSGALRQQASPFEGASHAIGLGDSLGEMALYGGLADVALLGGSFEQLGGQNLIELLACGCPVVMGPHTFNFSEAASLAAKSGVAFRVDDLASAILQGLERCTQNKTLSKQAVDFVAQHRGAAARSAAAIQKMLA